ncbi:GNAT family N-acetyltransferase [Halobacterium jilantaiense]|uniref:N-acetyltransferase domain-containing protein n=1 Tax=Halobacterium jilantaiense TaxID=355548 RepID=A0A1I0PQ59_9EURY|nr:hypothetical protein [Halobacterium jilantaiense]SEW16520.1 hypothetical protein SAMN04487945_1861 [Halobacterium jilantaiense]
MHVRDATAEDADAVTRLASTDVDADRLVRDRSVRVACVDEEVVGFLAYDTWRGAVHVTRFGGDEDTVDDLLGAPRQFANRESLPLEIVVPESEDGVAELLEAEGFEETGDGPLFDGEHTRRFRWTP